MKRLWNWVDGKAVKYESKARIFLLIVGIIFAILGFVIWMIVRNYAFDSVQNALCFVGYSGFCIGPLIGFVFLCRQ